MNYEAEVGKLVRDVQDNPDPIAGSVAAAELQKVLRSATSTLAKLRAGHMRYALSAGWSYEEIGDANGITRARVEQIVNR